MRGWAVGLVLSVGCALPALAEAGCGSSEEVLASLRGAGVEAAARTSVFEREPPWDLYEKSTRRLGKVFIRRKGVEGFAVSLHEMPAEALWRSLNDFELQVTGGYLPLRYAKVLAEDDAGVRQVVQLYKKAGMGRWWVNDIRVSRDLHVQSGGRLWEMRWQDRIEQTELVDLPQAVQDAGVRALEESRGSWLVIEVSPGCSVLEYWTISDPGGFLGSIQWLMARTAIRQAAEGMALLAADYEDETPAALLEQIGARR
jgi:hypothetical protein